MTPNCANTVSKNGQMLWGILPQGEGLHNSQKLRKVEAIYETGKQILSKESLSLKTRGAEKLLYS